MKEKTASVSVGFDYPGEHIELNSSVDDAKFYNKQMGSSVSNNPQLIDDKIIGDKVTFLKRLRNQVKDKEYVLFTYSGHGVYNSKGQWSMLLPGIPKSLHIRCRGYVTALIKKSSTPADVPNDCGNEYDKYLVSDQELRNIFQNKKVLAFSDSCFAGSANFGANTVKLSSALSDQQALASEFGKVNSVFTERVKGQFGECQWDSNKDGNLSAQELTAKYAVSSATTTSKNRKAQPKTISVTRKIAGNGKSFEEVMVDTKRELSFEEVGTAKITNQPIVSSSDSYDIQQNISMQNSKPWLSCFDLGATSCVENPNSSPIKQGDKVTQ